MADAVDPQTYARMRKIAEVIWPIVERLPGAWAVEIGAAGVVVMMSPVKRHEAIATRIVRQIDAQLTTTHPGQDIVARPAVGPGHVRGCSGR